MVPLSSERSTGLTRFVAKDPEKDRVSILVEFAAFSHIVYWQGRRTLGTMRWKTTGP